MAPRAWFMMYGYQPIIAKQLVRMIARCLIFVFRLNGKSVWSNEVIQCLNPTSDTSHNDEKLKFRTGNGRLLWRVRTFPYEEPMMMKWIAQMQAEDVVLDIGANCGLYSTAMAKRVSLVYACELDPLNINLIKENAYLNGVHDRVVILPVACGTRDCVVDVHFRDLSAGDALQSMGRPQLLSTRLTKKSHVSPVLSLSLDDLWDRAGFRRPTKIKIDVDGNEKTVFEGAHRLCATAKEIYFEDTDFTECKEVLGHLLALGFVEVDNFGFESGSAPGGQGLVGTNRLLRKN